MQIYTKNLLGQVAPLYHKYPRQTEPQGAFIEIDPREESVRADWNAEIGNAVPWDVWRFLILRIPVSPYVNGDALADALHSIEAAKYLKVICSGYSIAWNGDRCIGRLTESAQTALDDLERWLDSSGQAEVWEAGDWYGMVTAEELGVRADMTDDEIEALGDKLDAEASPAGYESCGIEIEGTYEYLIGLRDNLKNEMED